MMHLSHFLKLMIRDTKVRKYSDETYDKVVAPNVQTMVSSGVADRIDAILGYPRAGTRIAEAIARGVFDLTGKELIVIDAEKNDPKTNPKWPATIYTELPSGLLVRGIDDTATGGKTKVWSAEMLRAYDTDYDGLDMPVERDPLGTAYVREKTGQDVNVELHWLTIVNEIVRVEGLPVSVVEREMRYQMAMLIWKIEMDIPTYCHQRKRI